MVRIHTVMFWSDYPRLKVYWVVSGGRPNLMLAQVQVFGPLVLGPFGPDLGHDLDLSLTKAIF